ncbi:MAG: bifunctional DNA primase/polymerase [Candidatus Omnitrophota bacterium]|jgi:hypothetical protein
MSLNNSASAIVKRGYYVLPLVPNGKTPLTVNGFKDASSDPAVIGAWWVKWPQANIGLVVGETSDLCVLDIDPRNKGDESLRLLEKRFGVLPKTVTAETGGGGRHYYFRFDKHFKLSREFRRGIDLKKTGYVVVPPSIHASGRAYQWAPGLALGEVEIASLPTWLLNESSENDKGAKSDFIELLKGVPEGERNNAAASVAGHLIARGLKKDEIVPLILLLNKENTPPLPEDEIVRVVESIWHKHISEKFNDALSNTQSSPEELFDFLSRNIPKVEFLIPDMLQRQGRTMISAQTNLGKSVMVQNWVVALASGATVIGIDGVQRSRVLYLDCEMGESMLKDRFQKMITGRDVQQGLIHVKTIMGGNLLDESAQAALRDWIRTLEIEVLVLDPIGSIWLGDENDKGEVSKLTSFFDGLIKDYGIAIVLVHHWRKAGKDFKAGGEMAAGSYKWAAWVDIHITLSGKPGSLTVECQKARAGKRFEPFRIALDEETLTFIYAGDFSKKFDNKTLLEVFEECGGERVPIPAMIEMAKKLGKGSEAVIRQLIKESPDFEIDKSQKTHYITRKTKTEDRTNEIISTILSLE